MNTVGSSSVISLLFLTVLFIPSLKCAEDVKDQWPEWLKDLDPGSLGVLCESDNDTIGSRLGCSCGKIFDGGYAGSLFADCAFRNLGTKETQLPLRLNISSHVRQLDFSRNNFTSLNGDLFGQAQGIFELSFSGNQISSVHNLTLPRLLKLDLSRNELVNLTQDAFSNLDKLEYLDLSLNRLSRIQHTTFIGLTKLKVLRLGYNPISEALTYDLKYPLTLTNMSSLEELDLTNASLPDFPMEALAGTFNLKRLVLKNNLISYLPPTLHHLPKLVYLDLSGNLFTVLIAFSFAGLDNLRTLIMDDMRALESIENHAFAGLTNLRELSCQRNHKLSLIEPLAFMNITDVDKVYGNCDPKIVRLNDNNLKSFQYPLLLWKDMEELVLMRNPWVCDCNMRWVADFRTHKPVEASILIDNDFVCKEPSTRQGEPVASIPPDEMLCYSSSATFWGTLGIVIFCILISVFFAFAAIFFLGIDVPPLCKRLRFFQNIRGDSLPKYQRVRPATKPKGTRMNTYSSNKDEPAPTELEWDDGDLPE